MRYKLNAAALFSGHLETLVRYDEIVIDNGKNMVFFKCKGVEVAHLPLLDGLGKGEKLTLANLEGFIDYKVG